jgi:uncharacterized coiled-coil DUF342 family protein
MNKDDRQIGGTMVTEEDDWDREWDRMSHTISEYRQEIREMRERIRWYVNRIEQLESEVRDLKKTDSRWVQEP